MVAHSYFTLNSFTHIPYKEEEPFSRAQFSSCYQGSAIWETSLETSQLEHGKIMKVGKWRGAELVKEESPCGSWRTDRFPKREKGPGDLNLTCSEDWLLWVPKEMLFHSTSHSTYMMLSTCSIKKDYLFRTVLSS